MSTGLSQGATYDWTVNTGWGDQFVRCWIDFNDNFLFESNELIVDNYVIAPGEGAGDYTEVIPFPMPTGVAMGEHLMRGKTAWNTEVPDDPCEATTYGETEDYTVDVGDVSIGENPLSASELIVQTLGGNFFNINLSLEGNTDPIIIKVYNVVGQQVVENKVYSTDGNYSYQLDMSYAAKGSYLIRMGTNEAGKVKKIVVE
jgi:hypothetical protein